MQVLVSEKVLLVSQRLQEAINIAGVLWWRVVLLLFLEVKEFLLKDFQILTELRVLFD
jgi:hypothetical protein